MARRKRGGSGQGRGRSSDTSKESPAPLSRHSSTFPVAGSAADSRSLPGFSHGTTSGAIRAAQNNTTSSPEYVSRAGDITQKPLCDVRYLVPFPTAWFCLRYCE